MTGGHAVTSTLLTGENYKLRPSKRHGISLDQFIARHIGGETRFDKLVLAVGGGQATTVSFDQNGTPFPDRIGSAQDFYNRLSITDPKAQTRLRKEIASNRSILDDLRTEVGALEARLDTADRSRLDHYLTAIRDLEARMAKDIKWARIDKPQLPEGYTLPKSTGRGMHAPMPAMFDVAVLALQTDSTRVMSIAIGTGTPEIEGIEFSATQGKVEEKIAQLLAMEEAAMEQIARFLTKLTEATDVDGRPLLDTTTVLLLSSGIGNAHSHSNQHLPRACRRRRLQAPGPRESPRQGHPAVQPLRRFRPTPQRGLRAIRHQHRRLHGSVLTAFNPRPSHFHFSASNFPPRQNPVLPPPAAPPVAGR